MVTSSKSPSIWENLRKMNDGEMCVFDHDISPSKNPKKNHVTVNSVFMSPSITVTWRPEACWDEEISRWLMVTLGKKWNTGGDTNKNKIKLRFDNNARQDLLKKYTTHRIMLNSKAISLFFTFFYFFYFFWFPAGVWYANFFKSSQKDQ